MRKSLRKVLGVAASLLSVSMFAPSVFASTQAPVIKKEFRATILVGGKVQSHPIAIWAMDGNTLTTYMPVWYIIQALRTAGYGASWDAAQHTLNLLSTVAWNQNANSRVGTGNARIQVNYALARNVNDMVIKDPAGGANAQDTVYMPIYYIDQVLKDMQGPVTTWNGQDWGISTWAGGTQLHGSEPKTLGAESMPLGTQDWLYLTATKGGTIGIPWNQVQTSIQGPPGAFINSNGYFMASSPGQYTVTETFGPTKSSLNIDVYAQAAGVDVQPNFPSVTADGKDTDTIAVKVVDSTGNVVSDFSGQVQLSFNGVGGTLSNNGTVAIRDGMGSISLTAPTSAPSQSQILSSSNLTSDTSGAMQQIQYGQGVIEYVSPSN